MLRGVPPFGHPPTPHSSADRELATTNKHRSTAAVPDCIRLTDDELGTVSAGYYIREVGGQYVVYNDADEVVFTAATYGEAWTFCEAHGGRGRRP